MSQKNIQSLSTQLCELLGADTSNNNVDKVSTVLIDLLAEIAETNTKAYNQIVRAHVSNNPHLAKKITDEIKVKRDSLIANLSALR